MDTSVEQKIMRRFRLLVILSLITVLLSILSTVWIGRISLILTFDRNERRAREFVEKVVDSINQHTDYYKHNCSKDALADIDETISEITGNYRIILIDSEWSYYEYDLTFDGKNKFVVDVQRWSPGDFEIIHFVPIQKKGDR